MSTYIGSAFASRYSAYLIYKGTSAASALNNIQPKIGDVYDISEAGHLDNGDIDVGAGDAVVFLAQGWTHCNNGGADRAIAALSAQFDELLETIGETDFSKYALKTDLPTVPTKVSAFQNDRGYLTQHQSLASYALKTEIPDVSDFATRTEIPDVSNLAPKGSIPTRLSQLRNDVNYLRESYAKTLFPTRAEFDTSTANIKNRIRRAAALDSAALEYEGEIMQFSGTTSAHAHEGFFYKGTGKHLLKIREGETYLKVTLNETGEVFLALKSRVTSDYIEFQGETMQSHAGNEYICFSPNYWLYDMSDAKTAEQYNRIFEDYYWAVVFSGSHSNTVIKSYNAVDIVGGSGQRYNKVGDVYLGELNDEQGNPDTQLIEELGEETDEYGEFSIVANELSISTNALTYLFYDEDGNTYYGGFPSFMSVYQTTGKWILADTLLEDTRTGFQENTHRKIAVPIRPIGWFNATWEEIVADEDIEYGESPWVRWDVQPRTTVADGDAFLTLTNDAIGATIDIAYNSANQHLELKGKNAAVVSYVDMGIFIKDGMLDDVKLFTTAEQGVSVQTPYLKFTFNTASGKSVIRISLHDLVDVYDGANINLTSAFVKASTYSAPAIGDSVDVAVGKLLKGHEDNAAAIETKQATIVGAATTITADNLTASKALVSNESGKVAVSDTTVTELGYVHGTTSNIQQQLNAKATSTQGGYADSALQTVTASGSGYVTLMAAAKTGNNGAKTQALSASLTMQALATADAQHKGLAEASDVKAALNSVAAGGLKLVDLTIYQGQQGEIVKHVGPTTAQYVNNYEYKYNSTSSSVPILTLTDVDYSLSDLVPASQDTASVWTSLRTPFYPHNTYGTDEDDSHSNTYYLTFFADSESIDDNSAYMFGYNLDTENPTVQVGDWVYIYVSWDAPLIPDQVVSINGTKFTTESGRVYDTTSFDYNSYFNWLINEDGEEVVICGSPMYSDGDTATETFIYPKLHLSDRVTFTVTRYNPSISVTIYSTTTTSSWVQTDAQPRTVYTAGTGLKLSSNQFSLNVPRVTRTANSLPGTHSAMFEEYTSGSSDLPSSDYYHILTIEGDDNRYATQIALGMITTAAYYRNYRDTVWQPWRRLDNPTVDATPTAGNTNNTVSSDGVKTYVDNAVSAKQVLLSEADYSALATKDPDVIYYTY